MTSSTHVSDVNHNGKIFEVVHVHPFNRVTAMVETRYIVLHFHLSHCYGGDPVYSCSFSPESAMVETRYIVVHFHPSHCYGGDTVYSCSFSPESLLW
jgi:hypothetical protein